MTDTNSAKRRRALALVQEAHAGQTRTNGAMPAWHHVDRVSRTLERYLEAFREGTPSGRRTIALAALGHDAIEDSKVSRARLLAAFGQDGLALIEGMTNRQGDSHQKTYVDQVCAAPEGVRLIKLADLVDNCDSVNFTLGIMGLKWLDGYFLPIVRPMIKAISRTEFRTYRRTGSYLLERALAAYGQMLDERQRFVAKHKKKR